VRYEIIFAAIVIVLTLIFLLNQQSSLNNELRTYGASIFSSGYSLINVSENSTEKIILAQKTNDFVRLTVYFDGNLTKQNDIFFAIDELFKPVLSTSSYGVPVQTVIVPPAEVFPTKGTAVINSERETFYILYADADLNYEVYSLSHAQYKVFVAFADCKNNLFEIELFKPKDSFNQTEVLEMSQSFKC